MSNERSKRGKFRKIGHPCLASPFWWASGGRSVRPMGWLMKPVKGKFKP